MSLLKSWDHNAPPRTSRTEVRYGKVNAISEGTNVTIKYGSRSYYAVYDKTIFPDLSVGDQVAFIMASDSPHKVFLVRKAKNQYTEFAVNQIVD